MIHIDPRTKLVVLLFCGLLAFIISDTGLFLLTCVMAVYLVLQGVVRQTVYFLLAFAMLYGVQYIIYVYAPGVLEMIGFVAFFMIRFIPMIMAAAVLSAASPGELIAALQKLRVPKMIIISLAVALRYLPCIVRDYSSIHDAMRLRGISFFSRKCLKNPLLIVECAFVPLLMRSLKISDELAASASVRGIDYPGSRTCWRRIQLRLIDGVVLTVIVACGVSTLIFFT